MKKPHVPTALLPAEMPEAALLWDCAPTPGYQHVHTTAFLVLV